MMKKHLLLNSFAFLLTLGISLDGCNSTQKEAVFYKDYDLSKPDKFNMPESLFEISGITFIDGKADTVYAIQDEEGKLFRLAWDIPKQLHTKFGKKGDYEDVAIMNGQAYILKSNGTIYDLPMSEVAFEEAEVVKELKGLLPKGEYEGMYADAAAGELYVICKNCAEDDSKSSVTGYIFKPGQDTTAVPRTGVPRTAVPRTFSINVDEIKAITGKVARGFRPSGLAKNPVTKEWYMISAVNKLMVVIDGQWKVKDAFPLNGNVFLQPEGIAFDKAGNLYISNEGDDLFSGNILKFKKIK